MALLWLSPTNLAKADDARAQKARRAKAEKIRVEGYKLASARKYKKALEMLEKVVALETHTDPTLLFDLGALADGLQDCRKAILYHTGFLYTMPDEKEEKEVTGKLDRCIKRTRIGTIDFDSKPPGVEVKVNNVVVGRTPVGGIRLPVGSHSVAATRNDYHLYKSTIGVEHNMTVRQMLVLEKKVYKGNLRIVVEPADGVVVFLNHVKVGPPPYERKGLETRRYLIHVEREGWDRWVRYVTISKNSTTTVNITLEKTGTDVPVPPLPQN